MTLELDVLLPDAADTNTDGARADAGGQPQSQPVMHARAYRPVRKVRVKKPIAPAAASTEETLATAASQLRCVDWCDITCELLRGETAPAAAAPRTSGRGGKALAVRSRLPFALSRPVRAGEQIDAFVSHSWSDDAEAKYRQLARFVAEFEAMHGRTPTFWLDRCCLDQSDAAGLADALRMLPVHVTAAAQVLVLHGPSSASVTPAAPASAGGSENCGDDGDGGVGESTYASRLW